MLEFVGTDGDICVRIISSAVCFPVHNHHHVPVCSGSAAGSHDFLQPVCADSELCQKVCLFKVAPYSQVICHSLIAF